MRFAFHATAVLAGFLLAAPGLLARQRPATVQVPASVVRSCAVNDGTLTCGRTEAAVPAPARETRFVPATPAVATSP
jgi:hypothetical protein